MGREPQMASHQKKAIVLSGTKLSGCLSLNDNLVHKDKWH